MKVFALALISVVLADDPVTPAAVGTTCTATTDCGDATTMCCGVASGGKMCAAEACTDTTSTVAVPNVMICNKKDAAEDFILKQPNFDASKTVYVMYAKAGFTCMSGAKQLVAGGVALLAAASMM